MGRLAARIVVRWKRVVIQYEPGDDVNTAPGDNVNIAPGDNVNIAPGNNNVEPCDAPDNATGECCVPVSRIK